MNVDYKGDVARGVLLVAYPKSSWGENSPTNLEFSYGLGAGTFKEEEEVVLSSDLFRQQNGLKQLDDTHKDTKFYIWIAVAIVLAILIVVILMYLAMRKFCYAKKSKLKIYDVGKHDQNYTEQRSIKLEEYSNIELK